MDQRIEGLLEHAKNIRRDIVTMIHFAGDGHPGPSLSVADILAALYFDVLNIDPTNPQWDDRDRCILSKGHGCPALYSALARRGYFPHEELSGLRSLCSMLQGHPDMEKTPGVDSTSGSLGNGIAIGMGMAIAARIRKKDYYTYVVTGDGELEEGVVWEALMAAPHLGTARLIVIIDNNGMQSGGSVEAVSGLLPIVPKLEAFGWHTQEIDGHSFPQILTAVEAGKSELKRPSVILAHTVKGQGVPFMVGDNSWHKRVPTREELESALESIGAS